MNTDKPDQLDELLHELKASRQSRRPAADNRQLAERILAKLPVKDNVVSIAPAKKTQWNRFIGGAVAASLLAISIVVGLQYSPAPTADAFDQWAWEEVLDETPVNQLDQTNIGMIALLEPELLATDVNSDDF